MPELLQNVPTQNTYVPTLTLGPVKNCKQINFLGVGQPFFATLWKPDPNDPNGFPVEEGSEREYPANGSDVFQNVSGVKFRSKVAGSPANVYATLSYATDPLSLGASVTSASIGPNGGIVPTVGTINGVTGLVSGTGAIIAGSGFTVAHTPGTGVYVITFSPALTGLPVVTATCEAGYSTATAVTWQGPLSVTSVTFTTFDAATGTPDDSTFSFLAVVNQ